VSISVIRKRVVGRISRLARFLKQHPTYALGLFILSVVLFLIVTAPWLASKSPTTMHTLERLRPPSSEDWFGTDHFGRDVFARTIYGGRISLIVGLSVALLTLVAGTTFGLIAGYFRGLDSVIMRFMDGLMAIPGLLLAIALVALLGASLQNVIVALTITSIPGVTRVVRSSVLTLRSQLYVDAAVVGGATPFRILVHHILPNARAPIIVLATFIIPSIMLTEAGLSFLGAGSPPETPSWGNMIAEGRRFLRTASWMILFPGIFLSVTVVGVNLIGDALRDQLDPRLRGKLEASNRG
jgi:peptide/nickel transport system permease protein